MTRGVRDEVTDALVPATQQLVQRSVQSGALTWQYAQDDCHSA